MATLRLGAASTVLAYLAIALGGSQGLAQLGLFSLIGVMAAALTTRWLLPALVPRSDPVGRVHPSPLTRPRLRWLAPPLLVLIGATGLNFSWQGQLWDNNLSALSPVPADLIRRDSELRSALGTPDLSRQIVLRDGDLEQLLRRSEALQLSLADARERKLIAGFASVADLLPSAQRQLARQAALPDPATLRNDVRTAIVSTPLRPSALEPFLEHVSESRNLPPLRPSDFADTALATVLAQYLYQAEGQWVALVSLYPPLNVSGLQQWLRDHQPDASLIDLKQASENLVASYRSRTFVVLGLALLAIGSLLLWRLSGPRALWSVAMVLSVLVACAGINYALTGPLNLYHMMALLLVAGLGLDYALFLSRSDTAQALGHARHAVTACAASTTLTFAVLALSAIPALAAMGSTVAIGTALAFVAVRLSTPAAVSP